jgi:hypothetical protein
LNHTSSPMAGFLDDLSEDILLDLKLKNLGSQLRPF